MGLESAHPMRTSPHGRDAAPDSRSRIRSFDLLDITRVAGDQSRRLHKSDLDEHGYPFLCLYAISGGVEIRLGAEQIALGARQLVILRNEARMSIDIPSDSELLVVRLPRGACDSYRELFDEQAGRLWDTDQGSPRLAGAFLDGLLHQFDSYRTGHPARFALTLVSVLGLMCVDGERVHTEAAGDVVLDRARSFIDEHLADTELNPEVIAAALHVSTRTLHRLFERQGSTISAWVRTARLERCRVDLTDPRLARLRVSEIGARWGLWDAAHFSRLFKQAYGQSPRLYRLGGHSAVAESRAAGFDRLSESA